jgi:malate dehydrogenase (oxaloacetate-decarboxylating)(NADP+)
MTTLRGRDLLRDPRLNKFTAFTPAEREALGLVGLLPEAVESAETRLERAKSQLARKPTNLEKYLSLSALQDIDETLFYRLLMSEPARFVPLVYTPTVGEACLEFSHIIERPKGLYLSIERKGHVREVLRNWPERDVRFIVVTSGGRILGLGDLGANGMGIPIGKLALYTVGAGVPPRFTLPIMMDCGTDNETLLSDPFYIGLRRNRPSIAELDEFVEEFVTAVERQFPRCCIQWEDWARADAFRLLARYRERVCSFNDDIQGSGAVALAGILSALRITGGKLGEQTFLFLGAGAAAIGISDMLTRAMMQDGLTHEQACARIWLFNSAGLLETSRRDLEDYQLPYAHAHAPSGDFVATIESLKPTVIIGVSTAAGLFNQRVVEAMARLNRRPVIFALSNPTSRSECTAEEAYKWSEGRAVFASGSPFPPFKYRERTLTPGQCNNLYIFPAVGLAVYATRAARVTDEMFIAAARAVAAQVTQADLDAGLIYPPQADILKTEMHVAERIADMIFDGGLASVSKPPDMGAFITSHVYKPEYRSLV